MFVQNNVIFFEVFELKFEFGPNIFYHRGRTPSPRLEPLIFHPIKKVEYQLIARIEQLRLSIRVVPAEFSSETYENDT